LQTSKNKILAIFIAMILVSSAAISISAFSTVKGAYGSATQTAINQGMYWTGMNVDATANRLLLWSRFHDMIPTHVFLITAPNPIGIGQSDNIVMFNPQVPPNAGLTNSIRYQFTMTVVKPDGTVQNLPGTSTVSYSTWSQNSVANGKFVSDSTGSTYMTYVPDQVGNYSITVYFQQLQYLWNSTVQAGSNDYYGTTFLASNYTTTLSVQQQPVSLTGLTAPTYPTVPTNYWSRPIEQENPIWYAIASNYLHGAHDFNNGGGQNSYQPDGTAPNSGHILWTMPTEDSGIVGGTATTRLGNSYDTGAQYQPRFTNPIIMYGRLYYSPNIYSSGSSEILNCVDLKTGQLLWTQNTTSNYNPAASTFGVAVGTAGTANVPTFGYLYSEDNPNQHGIDNPGWLFTANYGLGYQPALGIPELHIANVPTTAGYFPELTDPTGANIRFVFQNNGSATNNYANATWYLNQWNSSRVVPIISGGNSLTALTIQGDVPLSGAPATIAGTTAYTWNGSGLVSVPKSSIPATFIASGLTTPTTVAYATYWNGASWINVTTSSPLVQSTTSSLSLAGFTTTGAPSYDWNSTLTYNGAAFSFTTTPSIYAGSLTRNVIWGYNGTWPQFSGAPSYAFPDNITVWEISTDPSNRGKVLYIKTIPIDDPTKNTNYIFEHANADAGANGVFIALEEPDMIFHVYDMSTGNQLWQSDAQAQTITPYNYYTWSSLLSQTQTKIAYGMLYTGGYGGSVSAYDLATGNLTWRNAIIPPGTAGNLKSSPAIMGLIADGKIYVGTHEHSAETPLEAGNNVKCLNATTGAYIWEMAGWMYPYSVATADGVLIYWNDYDAQIYAVSQGPTSMTVTAPDIATSVGQPITIRGTVMDVSPGTQQTTIKEDFPTGLPAVSDASQSAWMEYVYMQKIKPSNATGVPVSIDAIDGNGNFRHLGDTTSDSSGMFTIAWKPDVVGSYTIVATFAGSQSYYGSSAETSFNAIAAAPTTAPTATAQANVATTSDVMLYNVVGVIAIIIAIAIVGLLILRKRA
jgi:outer membrane protein assembly factor BamB